MDAEAADAKPVDANRLTVLVVAGPTASGKTALALHLAERLGGEVVNYDSMQMFRGFDLGTAKPSAAELARAPHHFIGELEPTEPFTAGEYARRALPRLREIAGRGRLPVLAGGSGFYLRALLEGLSPLPAASPELRRRLRRRGPERLHRLLARLDPESARRIAVRDAPKAIRALEVRCLSGRPLGELWRQRPAQPAAALRAWKLGLRPPRAELYARIDRRAGEMFAGGIQAETRELLRRYPAELKLFEAHGYKQACDLLLRGAALEAALAEARQEQRNYAKRQLTWFRRDPEMHWLAGFGDDAGIQAAALEWARARLVKSADR